MSDKPSRQHHGRIIDTSIRVNATPRQAWEAWADPQQIANWFVDRAEGTAAPGETMTWFFETFNYRLPVPIVEALPGRTFVTGSGDQPGPQGLPYLMEITITADEAAERGDATVVRLVNSGFTPDAKFDDEFEGVVSGWTIALATMKHWLERYQQRRRLHTLTIEPASYTWDSLRPFFGTPEGRARWLPSTIRSDATAVLADSGREVLLDWPEQSAVLGLKAFRMGAQAVVALDYSAWPQEQGASAAVAEQLRAALAQLRALLTSTASDPTESPAARAC
jgi:uncharacterized protein YndB with AHSA1/START domain